MEPVPLNVPELLKHFARCWRERFGKPYAIAWAKDGAQIKRLLAQGFAAEDLARYAEFYLQEFQDPFCKQAGYSLGVFVLKLPAVALAAEEARAKKSQATSNGEDFERLEAARKRLGGES